MTLCNQFRKKQRINLLVVVVGVVVVVGGGVVVVVGGVVVVVGGVVVVVGRDGFVVVVCGVVVVGDVFVVVVGGVVVIEIVVDIFSASFKVSDCSGTMGTVQLHMNCPVPSLHRVAQSNGSGSFKIDSFGSNGPFGIFTACMAGPEH